MNDRKPYRPRWPLDEVHVMVGGLAHWLWRAVDDSGAVLDILLQEHRDTEVATSFFTQLLREYDAPTVRQTDTLWSDGAARRALPVLHSVEHVQVVSAARSNKLVEQSHRPTRPQERAQLGFTRRQRTQEFLSLYARTTHLHRQARTTVSSTTRRINHSAALRHWNRAMRLAA